MKKKNKEEKETKKKTVKKKYKDIKLNTFNKILAFITISLLAFIVLSTLVGAFVKSYANFYWLNIRNPIMGVLYSIFKHIPFVGFYYHIIGFALIAVLLIITSLLMDTNFIKNEKVLGIVINACRSLIFIFLIPYMIAISCSFSDKNNPRLNEKYFSLYTDREYTVNDLIILDEYYRDKILYYIDGFERNENGTIIFNEDVGEISVNSLKKSSNKFNYLQGSILDRFKKFSEREHKNNTENIMGQSGAFGINYDPEFDSISLITILTHELCHTKGLAREEETVFCEVIANTEDDIDEVKYAGYIEGYNRISYALMAIDKPRADVIEDSIVKYCLKENYEEICNMYMKSINYYEKGTDKVRLSSYSLYLYENQKDDLFKALNILVKDFDAKLSTEDNENISLPELHKYMKDHKHVYVNIEVDEEKFDKLQPYLKKYRNIFLGIRQESEDDEPPIERNENESLEYYLAPFEGADLFRPMGHEKGSFMDEYDYERVVRLFLEYYNTYGYN